MPVERKPLFRPDVLREHVAAFALPERAKLFREKLDDWADLITSGRADKLNEKELLPDFLTDFFGTLLGYTGPVGGSERYTLRREKLVEVDGKWADAVLGDFNGENRAIVALEGKGSKDPLDRPFAGRKMSAVDQGTPSTCPATGLSSPRCGKRGSIPKPPTSRPTSGSTPKPWPPAKPP